MKRYKIGDLVWAKMKGYSIWPGRVSEPVEILNKAPSKTMYSIYFFGSNNYAWIKESNIKPYLTFKEKLMKSNKSKAFQKAVTAIEDYFQNYRREHIVQNDVSQMFEENIEAKIEIKNLDTTEVADYIIDETNFKEEGNSKPAIKTKETENFSREKYYKPAVKIEEIETYDETEESIQIKHLKAEPYEYINDAEECFKYEDIKYNVDLKEHSVDFSLENSTLSEIRCYEIDNENTNYNRAEIFEERKKEGKVKAEEEEEEDIQADLKNANIKNMLDKSCYNDHVKTECKNNYICGICNKIFKHNSVLTNHIICHRGIKKYSCDVCEKQFTFKKHLAAHLLVHNNVKEYVCHICDKRFVNELKLEAHSNIHGNIKKYTCATCNIIFKTKQCVRIHIMNKHLKGQHFICDICYKIFNFKSNLSRHMNIHSNNHKYFCNICGKIFRRSNYLKFHKNSHVKKERNYFCNVCEKAFITEHYLLQHMKKHDNFETHTCNICKRLFTDKEKLSLHLLTHSDCNNYICYMCGNFYNSKNELHEHFLLSTCVTKYKCDFCNKLFIQRYNFTAHLRTHDSIRRYSCDICKAKFMVKNHLSEHVSTHGDIRFPCSFCNILFTKEANLYRHIITVHKYETENICNTCKKSFNTERELSRHIEKYHFVTKRYNCTVCFKPFGDRAFLSKHILTHSVRKKYTCDVCQKTFTLRDNLITHVRLHEMVTQYFCGICNKSFRYHLSSHMATHLTEKKFTCDICNKSFVQRSYLLNHMYSHEKTKYFCSVCNKGVRGSKTDLIAHLILHTGEKSYTCNICKKSFAVKRYLVGHEKRMHSKKL